MRTYQRLIRERRASPDNRRHFFKTLLASASLASLGRSRNGSAAEPRGPAQSRASAPARKRTTSGPLLDWFYVHAGYINYKNGLAERWDVPESIEIAVQPAQKSDPLVVPDRPWEKQGVGYTSGTYFRNGMYVMHYSSYMGFQCVAESADGFHWNKPELRYGADALPRQLAHAGSGPRAAEQQRVPHPNR